MVDIRTQKQTQNIFVIGFILGRLLLIGAFSGGIVFAVLACRWVLGW